MCETDGFFASRHALIQDKAENTERCAGGGVVLSTGGEIHPSQFTWHVEKKKTGKEPHNHMLT